jgi:hypothetical protein
MADTTRKKAESFDQTTVTEVTQGTTLLLY